MKLDKFNAAVEPFWVFLHRGHLVRRAVLAVAVGLTIDSYVWAKGYAVSANPDAVIFAAVLGVPSLLLSAALGFYNSGRAAKPVNDGAE